MVWQHGGYQQTTGDARIDSVVANAVDVVSVFLRFARVPSEGVVVIVGCGLRLALALRSPPDPLF